MKNEILDWFCFKVKYPVMAKYYLIKNWFAALIGIRIEARLYANPLCRWPVNKKCYCGSGDKYKKCCRDLISKKVDFRDLVFINTRLRKKGIRL